MPSPDPDTSAAATSAPARPAARGLTVALDGPASSGKSSVGAAAATELGYRFFDTGLLYRAVTWLAVERGIGATDPDALVAIVDDLRLESDDADRLSRVLVDGREVTGELRGPAVDTAVSAVSAVPELRAALLERQRAIAADGGIVMAGRDVGTVVLPDADLKLFLDASPEERARRRAGQRGAGEAESAEILAQLRRRDEIDSGRAVAPLRAAADAVHLRTDGNEFEQTVALVVDEIRRADNGRAPEPESSAPEPVSPARGRSRAWAAAPAKKPKIEVPIVDGRGPLVVVGAAIARLLCRCVTRVRIEGALDELPSSGPLILAVNHASNADPVVVGGFMTGRLRRRLQWLGKRELFDWPVVGWLARHGGIHPVDRSTADVEAFRSALTILERGCVLAVFPEGTRSPDGRLQAAKDGLAVLALRSDAPIVPIGVAGSHRVWPRGRKLPKPGGRITVTVGRPFRLSEVLAERHGVTEVDGTAAAGRARRPTSRAAKGEATEILMRRIAELLPPEQRGPYGDPRPDA